jgi:hypothetical protein
MRAAAAFLHNRIHMKIRFSPTSELSFGSTDFLSFTFSTFSLAPSAPPALSPPHLLSRPPFILQKSNKSIYYKAIPDLPVYS